jgi:hypothetical protein
MNNKKPDLVVWDEEKGYYAKSLTYGTSISAPAIKLEDIEGWKRQGAIKVNHQFKTRYEELIEEAKKLMDEYDWNQTVYSAKYSFQPLIGHTYHLYINEDETLFLSLIEPHEWKQKFIASFKLDSTEKWIKIIN